MRKQLSLLLSIGCALLGCSRGGSTDDGGVTDSDVSDDASAQADGGVIDGGCIVRCGPLSECCGAGFECVVDRCLPACEGSRCGDDTLCCSVDELCVGDACVVPGAECMDDRDCAAMETCEPLVHRCVPIPPSDECRYTPPAGVFEPELEWEWTDEESRALPLVVQLTDDDGDGVVTPSDVPDVVAVTSAPGSNVGHLTALSGGDGHLLWQSTGPTICRGASPAAADLDDDGTVEIVVILAGPTGACGGGGSQAVGAFSHLGALEWSTSRPVSSAYGAVAIADLEGDGAPEVVALGSVFSADGTWRWTQVELNGLGGLSGVGYGVPTIADVDGDGRMELIASNVAFNDDGTVLWRGGSVEAGFTAVGRIVRTATTAGPEIVAVNGTTFEILDGATGASLFGPITYEPGGLQAGPPTIADFDGDGRAEVGVAGDARYVVFDADLPAPHELWSIPSMDGSTGSVGSTVFDFDADGSAEVIYSDERTLRILSGADGAVLWSTRNDSVTLLEMPVVADVDADGNAELVVVSNCPPAVPTCRSGTPTRGVRVFRDTLDNWVSTRSIWNQHTYHIDNVLDDGSIPSSETPSWSTHGTYRLNNLVDATAVTLAPDLVVEALDARVDACPVMATLRARVENHGARGVAAGVPVAFYAGAPPDRTTLLGVGMTSRMLLAGAGEWVEIVAADVPLDAMMQLRFYAVADDDGTASGLHSECMEDNNASAPVMLECTGPG